MKRVDYLEARTLLRENGRAALRWLRPEVRKQMEGLLLRQSQNDELLEREDILLYCRARGLACNVRHTASRSLLARFEARKNRLITVEIR